MSEPFLGSILAVAFNFAPKNWVLCAGQTMPINQYQALFSLLGTTYGGNGTTNFLLPDLRGRVPMSSGTGNGLSNYTLGQQVGTEGVALLQTQLPQHNHFCKANSGGATTKNPAGGVLAGISMYNTPSAPPTTSMNPSEIGGNGSSQPHENRTPFLAINWIIALAGIFPSRN